MLDLPDRVSIDLRRREQQEREAELEHQAAQPARIFEAQLAIRDPEALRKLLEDEELAGPLADLMERLDDLTREISMLEREHRVRPEQIVQIKDTASALAKIQRQLFVYAMGGE